MDVLNNIRIAKQFLKRIFADNNVGDSGAAECSGDATSTRFSDGFGEGEEFEDFRNIIALGDKKEGWTELRERIGKQRRNTLIVWRWAAVILVFFGLGFILLYRMFSETEGFNENIYGSNVQLILHTGERIDLSSIARESLKDEGYVAVVSDSHMINLPSNRKELKDSLSYNTLELAAGDGYVLFLEDGTKVYLNALSRLKYPVCFSDTAREVYLEGEAYFVVSKDSVRPFYVHTDYSDLRVYGTKFNINVYAQGYVETVLVEGRVGISLKGAEREIMMNQGDLLTYDAVSDSLGLMKVDTRIYTAWTEGFFVFKDECLERVLERLGRRYDFTVHYAEEALKSMRLSGSFKYFKDFDVILDAIEKTISVTFKTNDNVIEVFPKE